MSFSDAWLVSLSVLDNSPSGMVPKTQTQQGFVWVHDERRSFHICAVTVSHHLRAGLPTSSSSLALVGHQEHWICCEESGLCGDSKERTLMLDN